MSNLIKNIKGHEYYNEHIFYGISVIVGKKDGTKDCINTILRLLTSFNVDKVHSKKEAINR